MNEQHIAPQNIILCICAGRTLIDRTKALRIAAALREAGHRVTLKADLCQEVMCDRLTADERSPHTILACYPRAVRSLLQWKGLEAASCIDIRNGELPETLCPTAVPSEGLPQGAVGQETPPIEQPEAWFPVIDKERCTDCGKCHDFCLFGVYAKSAEGQVCVVQPQNCKNNCPACARVCPSRAIIFPKYDKSPINGGLTDEETFAPQEADRLYRERLRYKLQQRSAGIPLTKADVPLTKADVPLPNPDPV
ncbi:MAG: ferredoxin family protein [Prevotellaceae bacterium]|jgi:NAD-dependent dihydropyrimidine dehydrogenase PreA subunit|nr:ferredoxin family protein [Prevotellaceae bacterium]